MNLDNFKEHLNQNFSFLKKKKILIALSGGVDSVVLTHLFHSLNYTIGVAHCNFNLRGKESDEDQLFCELTANKLQVPFHTIGFATKKYATNQKKSIQLAARELRYDWFTELMSENGYDFLATAHHLNDSIETFLINLSRGTGLKGLIGIPENQNKIVRPLLPFSKKAIEKFAINQELVWREDLSNQEDKYLRNHVRLNVVPELEKMNDQFLNQFQKTINYLNQYNDLIDNCLFDKLKEVVLREREGEIVFDVERLLNLKPLETYLHLIFNPYGFSEIKDLVNILNNVSGKQLFNDQYRIIKSRNELFLIQNNTFVEEEIILEKEKFDQNNFNLRGIVSNRSFYDHTEIEVDTKKLIFPLKLRKKKKGDFFFPLGMKGKKKLSKFFKDEKLAAHQKEQVWLLENGDGKLIWIVGLRMDDRFKLIESTQNISRIRL